MTKNRLVLFDWNGTFVNDECQTVEGFREVLRGVGDTRWQLPFEELVVLHKESFSIPLSEMYDYLGFSDSQKENAKNEHYWKNKYFSLEREIDMQPGVRESLKLLSENGIDFGILSNHVAKAINKSLDKFGYSTDILLANDHDHEAHVVGKLHRLEKFIQKNPDTEILCLIGDSTEEIEIARTSKIKSVILTNGWLPKSRLISNKPDYLIDSSELPNILKKLI